MDSKTKGNAVSPKHQCQNQTSHNTHNYLYLMDHTKIVNHT